MQHITIAEIKSANLAALAKRGLGFQTNPGTDCLYAYGDGSHCAIGIVLNAESLALVEDRDLNAKTSPDDLVNKEVCTFENIAVADLTQRFHDHACQASHRIAASQICRETSSLNPRSKLPAHLNDFLDRHAGAIIDEGFFRAWINAL